MEYDLVAQSLERAIEKTMDGPTEGDISPALYQRFFKDSPESEELMAHMDPIALGNMTAELIRLVLLERYTNEQEYLNWEIENHRNAYSVMADMYVPLMATLISLIQEILGEDWNQEYASAWEQRSNLLLTEINQRF